MSPALIAMWLVAPYAGAWIETLFGWFRAAVQLVAPYAGAWIETWTGAVGGRQN